MICFECAKMSETVQAVAICQQCGVGLCFDHLVEATHFAVGGTHDACKHVIPPVAPLLNVPAGVTEGARHHSAGVA